MIRAIAFAVNVEQVLLHKHYPWYLALFDLNSSFPIPRIVVRVSVLLTTQTSGALGDCYKSWMNGLVKMTGMYAGAPDLQGSNGTSLLCTHHQTATGKCHMKTAISSLV